MLHGLQTIYVGTVNARCYAICIWMLTWCKRLHPPIRKGASTHHHVKRVPVVHYNRE